jgi:hypothetical protein
MAVIKFHSLIFPSLAIALLVIHSVNFPRLLLAQAQQVISQNNNDEIKIRFIPTAHSEDNPDRRLPDTPDSSGSRGDCIAKSIPMTRLVGRESLNLTVSSHPTVWVYVPYTAEEAPSGVFSLQDRAGTEEIWETEFQLPNTPGIVSITLPSNQPALDVDTTYRWYFELSCPTVNGSDRHTSPASITGLVQRVSLSNIEIQLNNVSTALERAEIYAQNGIWYETIDELANLRLRDRENSSLEQEWVELLNRQGLGQIAEEPIVGNVIIPSPVDRPE